MAAQSGKLTGLHQLATRQSIKLREGAAREDMLSEENAHLRMCLQLFEADTDTAICAELEQGATMQPFPVPGGASDQVPATRQSCQSCQSFQRATSP